MKLQITSDDIKNGGPVWDCPVDLAARRMFPDVKPVSCGLHCLIVGEATYVLPQYVADLVMKLTLGEEVLPFEFELVKEEE